MESNSITVKTDEQIRIMSEGGIKLGKIKKALKVQIASGVNAFQIEKLASSLIESAGGTSSFKLVPGYSWSTCVNVNDGIVHGIPKKNLIFKKGDVVSVDVGIFYKGFHTDTSLSVDIEGDASKKTFLAVGQKALKKAIEKAKVGNRIYDISYTIQNIIEKAGYSPVRALVGHGVGAELHEDPQIPCFINGSYDKSPKIQEGWVLAIEVMYTKGKPDVIMDSDGWTIRTKDGKISGLFEETVAITKKGPKVLTD